ncbi:hypothetical protein [Extibacter muris]|uniref:hypothetical protein n=1 Tax=Extibacter muris TaxID=1796622 RepID=UPI0011AE6925|nr:hypothetical protein [Extibacter muris]
MDAGRKPDDICSDASEAPTSPRPPNFAEESLMADVRNLVMAVFVQNKRLKKLKALPWINKT